MADQPCKTCKHYDPIRVGGKTTAAHGWCAALSLYPPEGARGRAAPPGANHAPEGERAKPHIVVGREVVRHCSLWVKAPPAPPAKPAARPAMPVSNRRRR